MEEKNYYSPIELIKHEKKSDDVVQMGRNYVFKINATLAKVNNEKKYTFYKEFEYNINGHVGVSIKRGFDYYLSIESLIKNENGNKAFVRIGTGEFYALMEALKEVISWFTDKRWKKVFVKKDNTLIMTSDRPATRYIYGLPQNKFLAFELIVVDGYIPQPGVRVTVGSEEFYTDITTDVVFQVYGALMNYNMFMSAQIMVSSLGIPLGTNHINLNDNTKSLNIVPNEAPKAEAPPKVSSIEGRRIGGAKTLSDLEGE